MAGHVPIEPDAPDRQQGLPAKERHGGAHRCGGRPRGERGAEAYPGAQSVLGTQALRHSGTPGTPGTPGAQTCPAFSSAVQQVSVTNRVTTYGSTFALGLRSSM